MREVRSQAADARRPDPTGIDAYRPTDIAQRIQRAGVDKVGLPLLSLVTLGVLAGAFIAFGALFYLAVLAGGDAAHGGTRLAAGIAFSLGLILVVVGGAELFTGNALIVMAWVDGQVGSAALLRNWAIVYIANFAGALAVVALAVATGLPDGPIGLLAGGIARAKLAPGPVELVASGILCNALVCLAVWLSFAARDVPGKVLAIVWPVSAFVALGFEHSVANMFLLPFGLLAADMPADPMAALAGLARNLAWVTLGNGIGGAGGVALAYWAAYRAGARS